MIDPLDRYVFPDVVRDLRLCWDPAWGQLSRPERHGVLVRHRRRFLTATSEGRTRLRAWLDHESPLPPMSRPDEERHVRYRACLYGDLPFLALIVRGLLQVPECVRHHVLRSVTFVGVGLTSRAWTASSQLVDIHGYKPRLIVLGPDSDEKLIAHESFHVWHAPLPTAAIAAPAISTQGELGLRQWAAAEGWADRLDEHVQRHERLAEGATVAWLSHV